MIDAFIFLDSPKTVLRVNERLVMNMGHVPFVFFPSPFWTPLLDGGMLGECSREVKTVLKRNQESETEMFYLCFAQVIRRKILNPLLSDNSSDPLSNIHTALICYPAPHTYRKVAGKMNYNF